MSVVLLVAQVGVVSHVDSREVTWSGWFVGLVVLSGQFTRSGCSVGRVLGKLFWRIFLSAQDFAGHFLGQMTSQVSFVGWIYSEGTYSVRLIRVQLLGRFISRWI